MAQSGNRSLWYSKYGWVLGIMNIEHAISGVRYAFVCVCYIKGVMCLQIDTVISVGSQECTHVILYVRIF